MRAAISGSNQDPWRRPFRAYLVCPRYGLPAGTGCFGGCLAGGGGGVEWEICGSHSSQRGRYQLRGPSSFIVAGSRHARTRVASSSTATARPTPISLNSTIDKVAKVRKTKTMTTAAAVTTPALILMPCATAWAV